MMSGFEEVEAFEDLRRVVEALDRLTGDDEVRAPIRSEVAEELEVSEHTVKDWCDGDYTHAVRTAGLIPNYLMDSGDFMVAYNRLNESDKDVTSNNVSRFCEVGQIANSNVDLTHNQCREKLGLDSNQGVEGLLTGVLYEEDGENFEHEVRGFRKDFLEEHDRVPSTGEVRNKFTSPPNVETQRMEEIYSSNRNPVVAKGSSGIMSPEKENKIFDFWIIEYLEEDWSNQSNDDVEAVMKYRMRSEDITERELDAVAQKYSKWVDFERYRRRI
jgi:hypothetical protein